ncbi:MAG: hypothetical protein KAU94_05675 [Verrucomicrobia bacterium]|nr:hypothetical protein [Verrucomicrobiota bacterium]
MAKLETRRINPIAHVTLVVVVIVIVFEVLVIFGLFELKAQTVAKYVPWAYEPFLKLVGEHPESIPRWATVEEPEEAGPTEAVGANMTGLEPSAIPLLVPTNEAALGSNVVLEASVPLETEPEPIPVAVPTNAPAKPEEIVPVG